LRKDENLYFELHSKINKNKIKNQINFEENSRFVIKKIDITKYKSVK